MVGVSPPPHQSSLCDPSTQKHTNHHTCPKCEDLTKWYFSAKVMSATCILKIDVVSSLLPWKGKANSYWYHTNTERADLRTETISLHCRTIPNMLMDSYWTEAMFFCCRCDICSGRRRSAPEASTVGGLRTRTGAHCSLWQASSSLTAEDGLSTSVGKVVHSQGMCDAYVWVCACVYVFYLDCVAFFCSHAVKIALKVQ